MKEALRLLPLVLAGSLVASPALAQTAQPAAAPGVELKVGDQAPDFTLAATDGKTYSLRTDLKGKWVVLAWFPKAFTAG